MYSELADVAVDDFSKYIFVVVAWLSSIVLPWSSNKLGKIDMINLDVQTSLFIHVVVVIKTAYGFVIFAYFM